LLVSLGWSLSDLNSLLLFELFFRFLDLLLVLFNHFLAEMAPFRQFFFHLLVVCKVAGESLYREAHLVVLVHEVLCLLRLVLQLASELSVLNDGEFSSANK
jgi:hypothetical protein